MSFDAWVEQRMEELRRCSQQYAEAKAKVEYVSEFKKSKLAILMREAEKEGFKTSAAQEREALANSEYLTLLDGYKEAVEIAERLRWDLKMAELGIEIWRTRESTKRAEMKGYGA